MNPQNQNVEEKNATQSSNLSEKNKIKTSTPLQNLENLIRAVKEKEYGFIQWKVFETELKEATWSGDVNVQTALVAAGWNNGEFSSRNSNEVETILIQMIQLLGNENQTEV